MSRVKSRDKSAAPQLGPPQIVHIVEAPVQGAYYAGQPARILPFCLLLSAFCFLPPASRRLHPAACRPPASRLPPPGLR